MKKANLLFILLAFAFLVLFTTPVQGQAESFTIYGVVYNGTSTGEVPDNLTVTLYVFTDGSQSGSFDTVIDKSGVFSFEGIALSEGDQVIATTEYLGVSYMSSSFTYMADQEIPDLSLAIYETTDDPSGVYFTQMSILLNEVDGELRLGEYYLLANSSDRTWIGTYDESLEANTTTAFSLSPDASGLWFSGAGLGDRFLSTADGFVDTLAVVPGTASSEVFFSYVLPFSGDLKFNRPLEFPVQQAELLVSEEGRIEISGPGINFNGVMEMDSGNALSYSAGPFSAGESLTFDITTKSEGGVPGLGWQLGIGLSTLALSGVGIFLLWRKPISRTISESAEPMLQEIAALDDRFEQGEVLKKNIEGCEKRSSRRSSL